MDDRSRADSCFNEALVLKQRGAIDEAVEQLTRCVQLRPDDKVTVHSVASVLLIGTAAVGGLLQPGECIPRQR